MQTLTSRSDSAVLSMVLFQPRVKMASLSCHPAPVSVCLGACEQLELSGDPLGAWNRPPASCCLIPPVVELVTQAVVTWQLATLCLKHGHCEIQTHLFTAAGLRAVGQATSHGNR